MFENQLTDLQNGDRLYYLARTPGMNLRTQLEGNSFAELVMRNTDAHTLKADAVRHGRLQVRARRTWPAPPAGSAASPATPSPTTRRPSATRTPCYPACRTARSSTAQINSVDPPGINGQAVYNGTAGVDRIRGGNDNDTFWGGLGNDIIEGGAGADIALGGEGDDIITDLAGDDVPKGGPGNDAIDAGPGLDIVMGGDGNDFTNGGANVNETFGGAGDDFVIAGQSLDAVFGDSGDDWEEGGDQPDLLQGDSGNLFFLDDSQLPGHDILIGQGGDDDYDMEGGDDIGRRRPRHREGRRRVRLRLGDRPGRPAGPGHGPGPDPIVAAGHPAVDVRDKFNEVEALSGWKFNDILRVTTSFRPRSAAAASSAATRSTRTASTGSPDSTPWCRLSRPPLAADRGHLGGRTARSSGPNVWGEGNILLGGAGSDLHRGSRRRRHHRRRPVPERPAQCPRRSTPTATPPAPRSAPPTSWSTTLPGPATAGMTLQQAVFAGQSTRATSSSSASS